jgi:ComF family protein
MNPLTWLFPTRCMGCGQILPIQDRQQQRLRLCGHCQIIFEKLEPPLCSRCGHPLTESQSVGQGICDYCAARDYTFVWNKAVFLYEGTMRDILHDVKFRSRKQSVLGLGELWASVIDADCLPEGCVLVPVPMHKSKVRRRGYNQAELLARAVSKATGAALHADLLIRSVDTPPQSGLNGRERIKNVNGVFEVNKKYNVGGKVICLIDDIFTTGASLNACADVLTDAGADSIYCMTLTIAPRDKKTVI